MRTLFVASTGGHLDELLLLRKRIPAVSEELWVTFPGHQAESALAEKPTVLINEIRPREWKRALSAVPESWRVIQEFRPDAVLSTGAAVAVPYLTVAASHRINAAYIESAARAFAPSLTGKLLRAVPGVTCVSQSRRLKGWRFGGSVFDGFEARPAPGPPRSPLRCYVSLGTMKFGFSSLLDNVRAILPEDSQVVWQHGHTEPPEIEPGHRAMPFHSQEEIAADLRWCDVVIAHAGVGSALAAMRAGKMPILVPRRRSRGEHVDNHQADLAHVLGNRGLAIVREAGELTLEDVGLAQSRCVIPHSNPKDFQVFSGV